MTWKPLMVLAFIAITTASTTTSWAQENKQRIEGITSLNVWSDDDDGTGNFELRYTDNGKKFRVRVEGKKIVEMYLDNKKLEASEFARYESRVAAILEQVEEDRKQAAIHREQAQKHRALADKERAQAEVHHREAAAHRAEAARDAEHAHEARRQTEHYREHAAKERGHADALRARAEADREMAAEHRELAKKAREGAEVHRKLAEADRKMMEDLIDNLVSDKLVESSEALREFILDNEQMLINGVKQSDDVRKRYSEKYLKEKGSRIGFNRSTNGTRFNVD